MEKIVALSEKTDVRDKFTKAIQYGSRLLAWSLATKDQNWEKRFRALFILARDSRKMFRLFKSVNEFKVLSDKILGDLIWQPNKVPIVMEILSKFGFFFYWIFDNLQILASIKFINGDPQKHLKTACWGWVVGLIFGIAKNIYDLIGLLKKKNAECCSKDDKEKPKKDPKLDFLIIKTLVEISGKLGDFITASNGAGIPQKLFNKSFSEGLIAVGGLWSSIVALWSHYLK